MSKDEFFAFMPLLLYGIAISELVMHWRDYLKKDRRYWPHLLTGLILLELSFVNFYYLYDKLDLLFETYHHFLMRISPPLVFLLMASVYTPEHQRDVKQYFHEKSRTIFTLLAFFIFLNLMIENESNIIAASRTVAILLALLIAWKRWYSLIWVWVGIRLVLFLIEIVAPDVLINGI